jgi:hypothetical protein
MGFIAKTILYGAIPAVLVGAICYKIGYACATETAVMESNSQIKVERSIFDDPVISNPKTREKYIPNFEKKTLEEVTKGTYQKKEKEKLIEIFEG